MTPPRRRPDPTESHVQHDRPPQSDAELHEVLGRAVDGFAPHGHDLVHRAAARGQRMRRARQCQLALAAVVLIGSAGLGLNTLGPSATSGPALPATSATPTPAPTATPADTVPLLPAPSYRPGPASQTGPLSAQLAAMLPARGTSSDLEQIGTFTDWRLMPRSDGPASERREVVASLRFRGGRSVTGLRLTLVGLSAEEAAAWPCTTDSYGACARLADGSRVSTVREEEANRPFRWAVSVLRPNGRLIRLEQFNPVPEQREMAVGLDEMTAVAADPHWTK